MVRYIEPSEQIAQEKVQRTEEQSRRRRRPSLCHAWNMCNKPEYGLCDKHKNNNGRVVLIVLNVQSMTVSKLNWCWSKLLKIGLWGSGEKCTSSPTPFWHSWQILWDNGVLDFLYLPSTTSSGKHPHLSCAITRLLFMEDEARTYCFAHGEDLTTL